MLRMKHGAPKLLEHLRRTQAQTGEMDLRAEQTLSEPLYSLPDPWMNNSRFKFEGEEGDNEVARSRSG